MFLRIIYNISLFSVILLLFNNGVVLAQKIENTNYVLVGDKMHLTYDLIFEDGLAEFFVTVYYGNSNTQSNKLIESQGEIGEGVLPGLNKKIIINNVAQFQLFSEDLNFRISEQLTSLPIKNFTLTNDKFKRGKNVFLTWQGGMSGEIVQFSLFKGEEEIYSAEHIIFAFFQEGTREGNFMINRNVKPSDNYHIQIQNQRGIKLTTSEFKVTRKIPTLAKVAGVLVIAGIVAILNSDSGGGSTQDNTSGIPDLPGDIHPGGG